MKKTYLTLLLLIIGYISVFAQKQNKITGTTPEKYNKNYVYLSKINPYTPLGSASYIDSAYITNGKFRFDNEIPSTDTVLYALILNDNTSLIVNDNEPIKATYIEGNSSGYFQIKGSDLNNSLNTISSFPYKLIESHVELAKKRTRLLATNEWSLKDEDKAKEEEKIRAKKIVEDIRLFTQENIGNPAGKYIYILYGTGFKEDLKNQIESKLSKDEKHKVIIAKESITKIIKSMTNSSSTERRLKKGDKYIDFEGEILSGDKIKFSTIISSKKLTLIDFWASWCVPCLKEMPEIVNLYNNYKDQGLQIVGMSLDTNKEKWKQAVKSYGMQWVQFIDSNLANPISTLYEVNAIPHTVLINEHEDIVAIGLKGDELKNKIEELLSKQ